MTNEGMLRRQAGREVRRNRKTAAQAAEGDPRSSGAGEARLDAQWAELACEAVALGISKAQFKACLEARSRQMPGRQTF